MTTPTATAAAPTVTTHTARITVPRAALLQQLVEAKRIVDTKAASPILHTVCLTIQGSEVAIAATDLRLTVLGRVAGAVSQPQSTLSGCLDVKKAHDIVKALGADVTLEIVEKTTTERQEGGVAKRWCADCGKTVEKPNTGFPKMCPNTKTCLGSALVDFRIVTTVTTTSTLSSGKSRFNLTTLRGSDFPKMPDAAALAALTWQTLPTSTLVDLIDGTLFSASQDTTREHLNACLLVSLPGDVATGTAPAAAPKLRMVSTDGHRLSRIDREGVLALPGAASILIPRDGVVELRKLCGSKGLRNVEVAVAKNVLYFRASGQTQTTYSTILSSATFPPYMQVIPRDAQRSIVVDVVSMCATVKRLMLAASEKTQAAAFDFVGGKLTLRTDNPDVGSAEEDVDYTVGDDSGATSDFKFGISLRYLGEALEHVATSSAKLCFDGVLDPMLLHGVGDGSSRDGGDVFVIMPCRL
mgnify:CR=1 FL=1